MLDKDTNNISLILNKNIINSVAWCSKEDYISAGGGYLPNDGKTCELMKTYCSTNRYGPITALNALYEQTKNWVNLSQNQITLPDAYKIAIASGTTFDGLTDISQASWLVGSYWTSTIPNSGDSAIAVVESAKKIMFPNPDESSILGIRPVITIAKSDIK